MIQIVFATGNENKLREAKDILKGYDIINEKVDLDEIQGSTEEVAIHKAKQAYEKIKKPCFVEDTGLCFNAFKGLPGVYIKHFLEKIGRNGLYQLLEGFDDKKGYAVCTIGYCDDNGVKVFEGKIEGTIVSPKGESRFGWDPIFQPKGSDKTFAEMSSDEKNSISHRKRAFEKFEIFLNENS